jgi:hypothetical protein
VREIPFPDAHAAGFHGELCAAGLRLELFLRQLARVDVLDLGDEMPGLARVLVAHQRDRQQRPQVVALLVAVALFQR